MCIHVREVKRLKSMLDFAINEANSTVLDKRKVLNRVEAIRQHVADSFDDFAIALIRRDEQVGKKILEMKKADIYGADSLITSCIGSGLGTGSIADCLGLILKTGGTYCINLRKK